MTIIITGIGFVLAAAYAVICTMQIKQLRKQLEESTKPHAHAVSIAHSKPASPPTTKPKQEVAPALKNTPDEQIAENKQLRQQVQALTQQLRTLQQKDPEQKDKLINEQKNRINALSKQLDTALQQQKQQQELQKELPVDLQKLPQHVLPELARVYRKAQHNEQLIALTRSKLHMAQDKHNELQKRYFSVCRELAMHSKQSEDSAAPQEPNQTHNEQAQASTAASKSPDTDKKPSQEPNQQVAGAQQKQVAQPSPTQES